MNEFSEEKASLQEQEAAGFSKRREERGQEALQEQAAVGTKFSLSAKTTTLNIEMLAGMQPEHGYKSTCNTLVFSHTSNVH